MNTLTASAPDSTSSATNATTKLVVTPSAIVPMPNSATEINRVLPIRRLTGFTVRYSATTPAPMPVAARSQPSPTAPTPRRSSAMAGSNATAPPKSTANRSSEIAPSRMGWLRTNRRPSTASCTLGFSALASSSACVRTNGCTFTKSTVRAEVTTRIDAAANGTQGSTT